jgi:YggT family protein
MNVFIVTLCQALSFAIIIRAVLSWLPINPYNPALMVLHQITEPILSPLRRIVPRLGMLDITPVVAIIILQVTASLFD